MQAPGQIVVTDSEGIVGAPLMALLAADDAFAGTVALAAGPALALPDPGPTAADAFTGLLQGTDVLILPDLAPWIAPCLAPGLPGPGADAITRLEALMQQAARSGVRRIVLLSHGALSVQGAPGSGVTAPMAAAMRAENALAALRCDGALPSAVVVRALDVLAPDAPGPRRTIRQLLEADVLPASTAARDSAPVSGSDRLHGVLAADLALALLRAVRVRAAHDRALDIAAPHAIPALAIAPEVSRLGHMLTDTTLTEVQSRPTAPEASPLIVPEAGAAVLQLRPRGALWTGLAQLVQAEIGAARADGRLPPLRLPMPAVEEALETGTKPLAGRVVLLTGATAGIGRAAAPMLARLGARLIVTGRSSAAGAALLEDINRLSHGTSAPAHRFVQADLSELSQVRALARQVIDTEPQIDLLINNAGAVFETRGVSSEGNEWTLALNLLAPVLLTRLLAAPLRAAAQVSGDAHVINVVSDAHHNHALNMADLQNSAGYAGMVAYGRSKSALVMMSRALAETAAGDGIRVNSVTPGAVRTGIWTAVHASMSGPGRSATPGAVELGEAAAPAGTAARQRMMRQQMEAQQISPRQGAAYIVDLAVAPQHAGASGLYLSMDQVSGPAQHTQSRDLVVALWHRVSELTGLPP